MSAQGTVLNLVVSLPTADKTLFLFHTFYYSFPNQNYAYMPSYIIKQTAVLFSKFASRKPIQTAHTDSEASEPT